MTRVDCNEMDWIDGRAYCPYYDYGVMPCEEVDICPAGYDDEEIYDEIDEEYEDEYEYDYDYDYESENKELDTDKNK